MKCNEQSRASKLICTLLTAGLIWGGCPVGAIAEELTVTNESLSIEEMAEIPQGEDIVDGLETDNRDEWVSVAASGEETVADVDADAPAPKAAIETDCDAEVPLTEQTEGLLSTASSASPYQGELPKGGNLSDHVFTHTAGMSEYHTITVPKNGLVTLTAQAEYGADAIFSLYKKDGSKYFFYIDAAGSPSSPGTVSASRWLEAGVYEIRHSGVWPGGSAGTYRLKWDLLGAATSETADNDTFDTAQTLNRGITTKGLITAREDGADLDFYRITVPYKQKVTLRLTHTDDDMTLALFDNDRVDYISYYRPSDYSYAYGNPTTVWSMTLPKGTYYVRVGGARGGYCGRYTLAWSIAKRANTMTVSPAKKTITAKVSKKKGKSTKAKTVAAKIAVKGAQGKVTYAKVGGSSRLAVNKTTGKITVKKGTKTRKNYTVKIRVTAAGNSAYSKGSKTVTRVVRVK